MFRLVFCLLLVVLVHTQSSPNITATPTATASPSLTATATSTRSLLTIPACSAYPITGLSPNNNVSVWGSTTYLPSFSSSCDSGGAGVSWFVVNPLKQSNVTASTCSTVTDFDTVIGIYTGSCNNLQCVTFNDDGCSDSQSLVTWVANEDVYYIGVTGYSNNEGFFELIVSETYSDADCTSAIPISGPYLPPVIISGSNTGSSPTSLSQCEITSSSNVSWYTITPSIGTQLNISTCSSETNFNTVLSLFSGSCSSLTCIISNDNSCSAASFISFIPSLDSYYIGVSGYNGATGNFQLEIAQPLSGISCTTAIFIMSRSQTLSGNTMDGELVEPVCFNESGPGNWYTFTTDKSQSVTFTTCYATTFDTFLAIYSNALGVGPDCQYLECVDYNDDYCGMQSQVHVFTTPSLQYYLLIGGYAGATGPYTITIEYQP